jgi:hypothetical protein
MLTAILAGAFGVFGTVFGAFITQHLQRNAAQEERIWTRQAETYLLMLQHHGSGMVDEDIETATEAEWAIRDELTAQASAFASDVVLRLWRESARANLRLNSYAEENFPELTVASATWEEKETAYESDAEFRRLRQEVEDTGKRLTARIRAELKTSRLRRRRLRGPHTSLDHPSRSVAGPDAMARPSREGPPGRLPPTQLQ